MRIGKVMTRYISKEEVFSGLPENDFNIACTPFGVDFCLAL